jgi:DNA-binding TFAR19-related protein (PDSD5 family)
VLTEEWTTWTLERTSELEAIKKARLANLQDTIHAIHHANHLYWAQKDRDAEARKEHWLRQEWLNLVRQELANVLEL